MSVQLDSKEVEQVLRNLTKVFEGLNDKKTKRKIMGEAAKPIVDAGRAIAPLRTNPSGIITRKTSAGEAKYAPGNLRRSIRLLPLRKAILAVVGPRIAKKGKQSTGSFASVRRANGYYAQFIFRSAKEFGRRVMQKALSQGQNQAIGIATKQIAALVPKLARKYGFDTK